MVKRTVSVDGGASVTSMTYAPPQGSPLRARLVLAHGAGANQEHPFMVDVARRLAEADIETVTFNFPYTEAGRRVPDRPDVLQRCFRAVVADVQKARVSAVVKPLFLGGKSLGGRMASHLVADGEPGIAGLLCLGYPLHPPGKPEQLRTKHLARIRIPVLVVQGARDPFGGPEELRPHMAAIAAPVTIFAIEEGDHSFKVPKRVGSADATLRRVAGEIARWMGQVAVG